MISARASRDPKSSSAFQQLSREGRDNVAWLGAALAKPPAATQCHVILLGGRDSLSVRVRVAQAHLRNDLTPSHWSHVLLAMPTKSGLDCRHIPLSTERGVAFPPATNGVQPADPSHYADATRYPNVAVIHVPRVDMEADDGQKARDARATRKGVSPVDTARIEFEYGRGTLDAVELIWSWLGFVWGATKTGNPLLNGIGIPSAVFVEQVLAAVRVDITPGLASRASCPEAIWQAARWWHGYYRTVRNMTLPGSWCVDDRMVPDTLQAAPAPAPAGALQPARPPSKTSATSKARRKPKKP